jgi:hypothetical protein
VDSFGHPGKPGTYVTTDYWVEFSRPVRADTVQADCFAMTVFIPQDDGWLRPLRIPIAGVETDEGASNLPNDHLTRATVVVDAFWIEALRARRTPFGRSPMYMEIEVLGDYIMDCNGQCVDANAVGLSPAPSGNGVPGNRFVSRLEVEAGPQPADHRREHGQGV